MPRELLATIPARRVNSRARQILVALLLWAPLAALHAAGPARPNFVFILGEGHGWSSTSVQMDDAVPASKSALVRTPNLEKLAAGGMRFANFYVPPSRASAVTREGRTTGERA
jgi:hypothetical protein